MIKLYSKFFLKSNIFITIFIFFFSFSINYYYSNIGVFPIDTFFHYDSSARILKNEIPIRDFWIVSGFFIDFAQSLFFKILGTNWNSYIIHSSIFNFIISIVVYYYFLDLKIDEIKSLFFTCCFAVLAYTISGTPFVDHHATFLLLISTILVIKVISTEKNYIWFIIIFLFFLSFLTKQVPAGYIFILQGFIILIYILYEKKYFFLKYIISGFIISLIFLILLLIILKINFTSFYIQYFAYPQTIGSSRFNNFDISLSHFFNKYKFLVIPILLIIFLKLKRLMKNYKKIVKKEIYGTLIFFSFIICVILHQILTKNQIYIYFLIPILFGKLYSEIILLDHKFQKYFSLALVTSLLLITFKYHERYNENRKFHELENINLSNGLPAFEIDKTLNGLVWVNPFFKAEPKKEILLLKKSILVLNKQEVEIMLISNYLFLDTVTNKNLNYPNRSFTLGGGSMPIKGNKYFEYYKKFLINKIKDRKIKKFFFFKHEKISQRILTDYIDEQCFIKYQDDIFYIFELECFS